ncbi:MAG: outer membrane beta-barrel protein [Flavobacteriales bacterium]|nr:outer membrane beta-barrel protein [Flavobacteriales bacterium]
MHRRVAFALLLLALSGAAQAQFFDRIGMRAGMSTSTIDWNYSSLLVERIERAPFNCFTGSLNLELLQHPNFRVMPEVTWFSKGSRVTLPGTDENGNLTGMSVTEDWVIRNLSLAVSVQGRIQIDRVVPYLVVGPRVDFPMITEGAFEELDRSGQMNAPIWGLRFGAGVGYEMGRFRPALEYIGFQSFTPISEYQESEQVTVRVTDLTMLFQFGLSYALHADRDADGFEE